MDAIDRRASALSRLVHSFSLKLSLLAIILLTVPVALYWQFERYENEQSILLHHAVEQVSQLIAATLRPHLANFHNEGTAELRASLASAATGDTRIKLLLRPATGHDFYYIMSSPPVSLDYLRQEKRELIKSGVFENLNPACDRASGLSVEFTNPAGKPEILTSIAPVHVKGNCWVVITSKSAASFSQSAPTSTLKMTSVHALMFIYIFSTALILWVFVHLWRNVRRFRRAARRIRLRGGGGASFSQLNTIPELRGVADDFDSLVFALVESRTFIRRAAEDTAHALKAPLAVIAQSIEPLRRAVPGGDLAAQRSIQLIERSVSRLDSLVSSAREMEEAAADVIYPECRLIDLSAFMTQLLEAYEMTLVAQKKYLDAVIAPHVNAYANEDIMEAIVENLLENAVSFTPEGGVIEVKLCRNRDVVQIEIADSGPGVDAQQLAHIFDRYTSYRAPLPVQGDMPQLAECHQGLGLWIVKHNVESLGGSVTARNRQDAGFEVLIRLRAKL
jgi:two-component system sensor histidine kinase ChvG